MQMILKNESHIEDKVNPKVNAPTSLKELSLNERLGNSSSAAAVYAAEYDNREYAVKIMFNYEHASNGHALKKGFSQECRVLANTEIEKNDAVDLKQESLPEHPNVIRVLQALVEETPCPSDALESYPIALPKRHFADGLGRNKTLCLIMPKYNCTLRQYITDSNATLKERKLLLAQLFEGVAHLVQNHEAHRDLKTDNILLDTSAGDCPKLIITDFGCCLGDETLELKLPFETRHVDRGGNSALMAPEVAMAVPGQGRFIDYSKADLWACGAIAFEIFGESNPFTDGRLENRSYNEDDVKELWRYLQINTKNNKYDRVVGRLIHQVLQRDPNERMTAEEAALMACVILYAPDEWWLEYDPFEEDVTIWFLKFWSQYLKDVRDFNQKGTPLSAELTLQGCFLRRASFDKVLSVVKKFKENF
ncbi:serine/threonine-protein kinase Pink1, mitochondrial-like isoform X1 [Rhopilema esculentum]|uniref:serine/threonine-protein kinase Pink1, mitochondrial-like isoform X1 n=1 Tax=Rhopilema esculentum TaxID=499914 RepID=UPI0031E1427E